MSVVDDIKEGTRLLDKQRNRERVVRSVSHLGKVLKIWFDDPKTGGVEPPVAYPITEVEQRFEVLTGGTGEFRVESEVVRLVAESHRLGHAYLFNPVFATETSLIDPLPHQLIAVDDHLLGQPRLRFLLADDAGAGKTIMAGLYIREMLLRRLISRVLIIPPAGLVGNWERELRNLFRLRFRILSSADGARENPFEDSRNDLAIVSIDTVDKQRMRTYLREARPYDLVVFDEAHKLTASRDADLLIDPSKRYELAAEVAAQMRHLLLLTATPHMGKDDPYYFLWRLLEPELLSTPEAFNRLSRPQRARYFLRRMKEEMVRFDETPLYPPRSSQTPSYPLSPDESRLYEAVTNYCEIHYNRAQKRNRGAAGLAMSVLQRRLASSTWAILRSLERRETKLSDELRLLEQGLLTAEAMDEKQRDLPTVDVRNVKTGDEEEAEEGSEEAERNDEDVSGATDAISPDELRIELEEVRRLVVLAREVYALKSESKFEKLWEALKAYPDTKVLIFTEHRDTMSFLIGRLEALGLAGKIAHIDGSMDYREREQAAEFFRDPNGARYLVATDAAGEGINLQFCWLLVNYDIPWNPARIEQRMGRVHRYKQTHDVLLLNLVAEETREGRVLKVLLDKLEKIRDQLSSDKVFDVIGQQFGNVSLPELILRAVVEGRDVEVARTIDATLTKEKVEKTLAEQRQRVECADVRRLLDGLKRRREESELKRMMPAYVRGFFERAAPLVGIGIVGDAGAVFGLDPIPETVRRAMMGYPDEIQNRLTFLRELAMPPDAIAPRAVYLHPGEPVFEVVNTLFLGRFADAAERGGTFLDPAATTPYLFYLVRVPVLRERAPMKEGEQPEIETVEETMVGVRRFEDGRCEEVPAHQLLELFDSSAEEAEAAPANLVYAGGDATPVEAFVYEKHGTPLLEHARHDAEERFTARQKQLRNAYSLYEAELLETRRRLKDAVAKGEPAASTKLKECGDELGRLNDARSASEAALLLEIDSLRLGPVTVYARALVLPMPPDEAERRRDDRIEAIAMKVAWDYERSKGGVVEDVHDPKLAMGFDLKSTRPSSEVRYIEVKGRARVGELELTENEWAQARNHPDRYWLYVVYNCDGTPTLKRIKNPAGKGIGMPKGGVTIAATDVMSVPDDDDE